MSDLIDRQAAYDAITAQYHHRTETQHKMLAECLDGVPSIDAVEVVRCGECKYMMPNGACYAFADPYANISASDFCSRGERKDGKDKSGRV